MERAQQAPDRETARDLLRTFLLSATTTPTKPRWLTHAISGPDVLYASNPSHPRFVVVLQHNAKKDMWVALTVLSKAQQRVIDRKGRQAMKGRERRTGNPSRRIA